MAGGTPAVWLFVLLNYLLSALMYSLLARFILAAFLNPDSRNPVLRLFVRVTEPAVRTIAVLTPKAVPTPVLVLFSAVWMLILRFVLFLIFAGAGLLPATGG